MFVVVIVVVIEITVAPGFSRTPKYIAYPITTTTNDNDDNDNC